MVVIIGVVVVVGVSLFSSLVPLLVSVVVEGAEEVVLFGVVVSVGGALLVVGVSGVRAVAGVFVSLDVVGVEFTLTSVVFPMISVVVGVVVICC